MQEKQDTIVFAHMQAERAADELRRQLGIRIELDAESLLGIFPAEFLTNASFTNLLSSNRQLLLTGARAKSLKLDSICAMQIDASTLSLAQLQYLSDPLAEKTELPELNVKPASEAQQLALKLAKHASLLPALLAIEGGVPTDLFPTLLALDALRIAMTQPMIDVIETAQATLPLKDAENSRLVSFRLRYGAGVHLALIVGEVTDSPLVRVHSSCVTGDLLGSLRCDCGNQLCLALDMLREQGGVLIYLHQEGRGIGITNKLRAYELQELGYDTYEANLLLGFDEDERDFSLAAAMLKKLGVHKMRLLTNNPQKMAAIEKAGMNVVERVPLVTESGRHNHAYLQAKAKKSGHLF